VPQHGFTQSKGVLGQNLSFFKRMRFAKTSSNNIEALEWFTLAVKRGHAPSLKDKSRLERFMSPPDIEVAQLLAEAFEENLGPR
jgi:hypothetical protein